MPKIVISGNKFINLQSDSNINTLVGYLATTVNETKQIMI